MNTDDFRKVKIVATIGPATDTPEMLEALARAGVDVFRLNLSHRTRPESERTIGLIRDLETRLKRPLTVMGDLAGPKIRIGQIAPDQEGELEVGHRLTITPEAKIGTRERLSLNMPIVIGTLSKGDQVWLGDGNILLEVSGRKGQDVQARVVVAGKLRSRMGFSCQGLAMARFALSAKDKADIKDMVALGADALAVSFVQTQADIVAVRKLLPAKDAPVVIAKIETMAGVENAESILSVADGLMVARGDLGFSVPMEDLPHIQKELIALCLHHAKPCITATQMMESMTQNAIPTRAEVTDVANAILDGTDAVMLSGETASGKYPVQAVETMSRIIGSTTEHVEELDYMGEGDIDEAVASSVVETANRVEARAIVAFTESGATARRIARHRPRQLIVALSPYIRTLRAMNFSWGIEAHLAQRMEQFHEALPHAQTAVKNAGISKLKKGDRIVISAGLHEFGTTGSTNLLLVEEV